METREMRMRPAVTGKDKYIQRHEKQTPERRTKLRHFKFSQRCCCIFKASGMLIHVGW